MDWGNENSPAVAMQELRNYCQDLAKNFSRKLTPHDPSKETESIPTTDKSVKRKRTEGS